MGRNKYRKVDDSELVFFGRMPEGLFCVLVTAFSKGGLSSKGGHGLQLYQFYI